MRFTLLPSRKMTWRRRMIEYAFILPVIYVVYCVAVYFVQDRFVFPRSMAGPGRPAGQVPRGVESIWIDAGTAAAPIRTEAWFAMPEAGVAGVGLGVGAAPGKVPAVIFFHGNGELIDSAFDAAAGWRRRGYAVLFPEFRGYGRSGGEPSQAALTEDAVRFYDILAARPEIDAARIVLHGRSLGGGVAVQLAAARPAAALVLESTFTSAASFSWSVGAPPLLMRHPFRSDRVLPRLGRPVLFLHGVDDEIIPVEHSRRLHAMTPGSVVVELPGHHNDFPVDRAGYWRAIDGFLECQGLPAGDH